MCYMCVGKNVSLCSPSHRSLKLLVGLFLFKLKLIMLLKPGTMPYAEIHSTLGLAFKPYPSFSEKNSGVWEAKVNIQIRQSSIKSSHTLNEFCSNTYFSERQWLWNQLSGTSWTVSRTTEKHKIPFSVNIEMSSVWAWSHRCYCGPGIILLKSKEWHWSKPTAITRRLTEFLTSHPMVWYCSAKKTKSLRSFKRMKPTYCF